MKSIRRPAPTLGLLSALLLVGMAEAEEEKVLLVAGQRAAEAGNGVEISYSIPKPGTIIWFDTMAIPNDAPHPGNAHLFINYILEPEVVAGITNYLWFANSNAASVAFIDEEIIGDPGIYPPEEVKAELFPAQAHTSRFTRTQTRAWTRFKTGR